MIQLDGSHGEGGGQMLRTALSLSLVTGQAFRMVNVRAGRSTPGLRPQHLAAVESAKTIGAAEVTGAAPGSQELDFVPRGVKPGDYSFSIGTAGSVSLLLQTLLPALVIARGPSNLVIEGGTHNPMAPPFEFLAESWLPVMRQMGARVKLKLDRHGFYPVGGGKVRVFIEPVGRLEPVDLLERGAVLRCRAIVLLAGLARHVAERELKVLKRELGLEIKDVHWQEVRARSIANVVEVFVETPHGTGVFTGFGERGVRAEAVAGQLAKAVFRYLEAGVPVDEHLADQLLLPLALAGGGSMVTLPLSAHSLSNMEVIRQFLPVGFGVEPIGESGVRVWVREPERDAGPANADGLKGLD